jgi:hypothetical protein
MHWLQIWHIFREVLFIIAVLIIIPCIVWQRRALNKIAFGRSMFISWSFIIFGWIVGLLPSIEATIFSVILLLFGFLMIVYMGVKSRKHLLATRRR